jgi:hypothetical protein
MVNSRLKYLILCTLLAVAGTGQAQNKGLVDSRVTLDSKDLLDGKQNDKRQADSRQAVPQTATPGSAQGSAAANAAAAVQLPSKHGNTSVSATLDADSIIIGDQTTLRITVKGIDGKGIGLPTLQELTRGGIEALESRNDTTLDASGKVESIEQQVTITSFDAGRMPVGVAPIRIADGGQAVLIAPSDSLVLTVAYVAEADTVECKTMADADYIKEPFTFWEVTRWVVYAIVLAAVVLAIIVILKRRKEHKPILALPGAKPVPADRKALSELEALRRKELWQKGRIKKYYTDMTDIVRRFLRNMYGISAAEMTTRQTLKAFHGIEDWSEESESLLRQLLQKADMVKFAKSQPEAYEHDQAMQFATDFVRKVAETHKLNNAEKEEGK